MSIPCTTLSTLAAGWFKSWEDIGLIGWQDKTMTGAFVTIRVQVMFDGKPTFDDERRGDEPRNVTNTTTDSRNEVYVDRDIMVLANLEIAHRCRPG